MSKRNWEDVRAEVREVTRAFEIARGIRPYSDAGAEFAQNAESLCWLFWERAHRQGKDVPLRSLIWYSCLQTCAGRSIVSQSDTHKSVSALSNQNVEIPLERASDDLQYCASFAYDVVDSESAPIPDIVYVDLDSAEYFSLLSAREQYILAETLKGFSQTTIAETLGH